MRNESVGRLGHGRILLPADVKLGLAGAVLLGGDVVEDHLDVGAAAPPGGLVWLVCQ